MISTWFGKPLFPALLIALVCHAAQATAGDLPNVVMIMADDLGWSEIGAYRRYQGLNDPVPTPNLDRLCAQGMMFTDAHTAAAYCAPTRFSMMTGSNPQRNGARWGTWALTDPCAFFRNRIHSTVGDVARAAGYRTAFLGKMHFGGGTGYLPARMMYFPTSYGFDYMFGQHDGIWQFYVYFENDRFVRIDPADPLNPSVPGTAEDLVDWTAGSYTIPNGTGTIRNDWVGDVHWNFSQNGIINSAKAAAFIRDHRAHHPDRPFMMYYCPPQVHTPHNPPIDFEPNPDGTPGNPPNVPVAGITGGDAVADVTYELDLQVGRILAALEDPDGDGNPADSVLTNTLVMFTSDNGGTGPNRGLPGFWNNATEDTTGILTGTKGRPYEGGHRVPFVAMWPGRIATNTVSDQLIATHDWVGLMYALTETCMPTDQAMDCVNILPVLLGQQPEYEPVRDFLLLQSRNESPEDTPFILRQGDYVLFMDIDGVPRELYNLAVDLRQLDNLIGEPSEQQRVLEMETLYKQYNDTDDPCSTPRFIPVRSKPIITSLTPDGTLTWFNTWTTAVAGVMQRSLATGGAWTMIDTVPGTGCSSEVRLPLTEPYGFFSVVNTFTNDVPAPARSW